MVTAGLWALAAASTLLLGSLLALAVRVPRRVVGTVLGFGAGALLSAVAYDLTEEALVAGGGPLVAVGLAVGAATYFTGNRLVRRVGGAMRPARGAVTTNTNGPAIVLGALLDGVPESIVLGATLLGGGSVSVAFFAAVAVSNLPEAFSGTVDLRDGGFRPRSVIGLWVAVVVCSSVAAAVGYAVLGGMSGPIVAVVQAFAAGAILTMLADTMIPEAYETGGDVVGLLTVLGFSAAAFLAYFS